MGEGVLCSRADFCSSSASSLSRPSTKFFHKSFHSNITTTKHNFLEFSLLCFIPLVSVNQIPRSLLKSVFSPSYIHSPPPHILHQITNTKIHMLPATQTTYNPIFKTRTPECSGLSISNLNSWSSKSFHSLQSNQKPHAMLSQSTQSRWL